MTKDQPAQAAAAKDHGPAWLTFIRQHGQPCFVGWQDEVVLQWLNWHAMNDSLIVIQQGDEVLALMTGWQCFEADIEQHWQMDNPRGDSFYFSHAIATSPVAFASLIAEFNRRWPNWRGLKLYWRRARKGLVSVSPETIFKLFSLAQRRVRKENNHE